jgi:hypothetical protein
LVLEIYYELAGKGIATWITPKGGFFISLDAMRGTAKESANLQG